MKIYQVLQVLWDLCPCKIKLKLGKNEQSFKNCAFNYAFNIILSLIENKSIRRMCCAKVPEDK